MVAVVVLEILATTTYNLKVLQVIIVEYQSKVADDICALLLAILFATIQ